MKLLTKKIEKALPALGSTFQMTVGELATARKLGLDSVTSCWDAVAVVKFFTPWSSWTWYATEYDPAERLFFGMVDGPDRELGYFSLDELEEVTGPWGLKIERDLYWEPATLAEIRGDK